MNNPNTEFMGQFEIIFNKLNIESERGTAIIAAAAIDEVLEEILKSFFQNSDEKQDELFSGSYAPLGTLSAKISLSYRLGLISPKIKKSLNLIRKIRNDFAHLATEINFESSSVRDRIREMFMLNQNLIDSIYEILENAKLLTTSDSSNKFQILVTEYGWKKTFDLVVATLVAAIHEFKKTTPKIKSHHRD